MKWCFSNTVLALIVLLSTTTWAEGSQARSPNILIFGDSLSVGRGIDVHKGWVNLLRHRLKAQGYSYHVINASISGDTTTNGLSRLPDALSRDHPAILIIELGGNDGLLGTPLDVMQQSLLKMISLGSKAGARVLLLGVRLPPNYGPAYINAFENVFKSVAKQTHTPLVAHFLAGVATHRQLMQSDGIHPTAAAQGRLLDNVWPILKPLL